MSDCCSVNANSGRAPAVMACPANGARSKRVDALTVKSLVRKLPLGMPNTQYYFCDASDCELVYFALDREAPRFRREDLVVRVGAKETTDPIPICYCFGFTRQDVWDEIGRTGKSTVAERRQRLRAFSLWPSAASLTGLKTALFTALSLAHYFWLLASCSWFQACA